jgi:hypothetical protein
MLASMVSPTLAAPVHEQTSVDVEHAARDLSPPLGLDDRICPGCKKSAVSEQGGLVVAFGSVSRLHDYVLSPSHHLFPASCI